MELTTQLKKRFCKDCNLSLQLYDEPYFTERVRLLGKLDELNNFKDTLDNFKSDEDFLNYNNKVRDSIIDYIKESSAFKSLNSCDMNKYAIPEKYRNFAKTDVYKIPNIGHHFISIDLRKANFSALVKYAKETNTEFFDSYNWEDFMHKFTELEYFTNSKYIRQVVFGNCNPKRQIGYESYLITKWLEQLEEKVPDISVYCIHSDEVILRADSLSENTRDIIKNIAENADIPLKFEFFILGKITNSDAFIKCIYDSNGYTTEVKCIQPWETPAIYRMLYGEEPSDDDLYFDFNGRLAKFNEPLEYKINF